MNEKILKIIKIGIAFSLSLCFIISSLYTYRRIYAFFYELSFLGNFITGIFLFVAGILWIFNKKIPQYLFLCFTGLLLLISGVVIVNQDYFSDGWGFLHYIDPMLMLVFYLFVANLTGVKWYFAFTALLLPSAYVLFAFISGACTGSYIYYYLNYNEFGVGNTVSVLLGIAAGLAIVSFGLYFLNKLIHKHILKNI